MRKCLAYLHLECIQQKIFNKKRSPSHFCKGLIFIFFHSGAGCETRTRDLLITSQLLYQLS